MGGLNGTDPDDIWEHALANHHEINCLDDYIRESRESFMLSNPQIVDPNCKDVEFLEVAWKYISKVGDLMDEMQDENDRLKKFLKCYSEIRSLAKRDFTFYTKAQALDGLKTVVATANYLANERKPLIVPVTQRLQSSMRQCLSVALRVNREYRMWFHQVNSTDNRILNPDLSEELIPVFIRRCHQLVKNAIDVVGEFHELRHRLKKVLTGYSEEQDVRRMSNRQWRTIRQYGKSTLGRFSYCVYSCAYRPLNTNVYCSLHITSAMTIDAYSMSGPEWIGVKELRIFYHAIFKHLVHQFPSVELFPENTSTTINSLEISNTEIMTLLTILSSVRQISVRIRIGAGTKLPISANFFSASVEAIQSLSSAIARE